MEFTAQQTLDYLQSLYEKRLVTYPRTDSRYLTDGMAAMVPALVSVAAKLLGAYTPASINAEQVCNSSRVTDHHAVVPTPSAASANLAALPDGESAVLRLVCRQFLCAVSMPFVYAETTVYAECAGHTFKARGKAIIDLGWRAHNGAPEWTPLPELAEGASLNIDAVTVKEGKTTPPAVYTEDTLLSAMEHAGAKEAPSDAERRGLGTPATRAATIEKLVTGGFAERVKGKLVPTSAGASLVTVLPDALRSPLLTAEWEQPPQADRARRAGRGHVPRGHRAHGQRPCLRTMRPSLRPASCSRPGAPSSANARAAAAWSARPRSGYFCEGLDCKFGLWRDNKFLAAKRISLTRPLQPSCWTKAARTSTRSTPNAWTSITQATSYCMMTASGRRIISVSRVGKSKYKLRGGVPAARIFHRKEV